MPNNDQTLDLEKLKTDPKMWMRLATPLDGSNVLKHVFSGTENPFEKNSEAAMEKLRKLAAEGQLYMREFGRSQHFQKVEPEGEKLKLGQQHEMKVSRSYSDPVLGGLMYASRAYFKWIGLESVSKWFDKRLERRNALIEKDKQYDEEYKSLTKEQKKELKQRRSQEKKEAKARQRLEKAEKELAKAREELDQIQGKNTATDKGELNAPVTQPPKQEEKSSMQPTLEGDQPQLQKQQEALTREEKQPEKDEKIQKRENPSAPATAPEEKKGIYLVSGDKTYTDENIHELPEEVRKMLDMIQKVIEQMEAQKKQDQLQQNPQPTDLQNEQQQQQQQQQQTDLNAVNNEEQQIVNENAENPLPNPQGENEQEQQAQEQQAQEQQAQTVPEDWRDMLVSALFSHQKGSDMLAQYQEIKDDPLASMLFLADTVFGLLKQNITGPESNQQLMEEIFSGRSLGDDRDEIIRAGLDSAKDALTESFGENNSKPLEEMLTTAVRELKEFAGDGNNRTPQQELAGMMIEMAEEMAKDHGLQLPQEEAVQQMGDQKPQAQQEAPLNAPPNMEADKIKIQQRQPDQKPLTFPERLEAEKQALEATKHWRDTVSNSLFSHQGGEDLMNTFNQMRSHPRDASNFLTTAVLGLIGNGAQKNGGEKNHQQMLDALLDGRPLGAENDNFIRGAANRAKDLMQNDDPEKMKNLLGDAVRGLGWQATQEPELSVRHVMIGMLISAAMTMAGQRGLNLGLNAADTRLVQCASEMGKIALNYENARQYFANNPLDHTNENCRTQLQNLLAGNAVDKSIELDRSKGQNGVTNTHTLMGGGVWTEANLRTMSQSSRVRSGITQDQLQQMLEDPHGKIAHKAGHSVSKEMISGAQDLMSGKTHSVQLERSVEQDQLGPEKQPMQFMG